MSRKQRPRAKRRERDFVRWAREEAWRLGGRVVIAVYKSAENLLPPTHQMKVVEMGTAKRQTKKKAAAGIGKAVAIRYAHACFRKGRNARMARSSTNPVVLTPGLARERDEHYDWGSCGHEF